MKLILILLSVLPLTIWAQKEAKNIYAFDVKTIEGKKADLSVYKGGY